MYENLETRRRSLKYHGCRGTHATECSGDHLKSVVRSVRRTDEAQELRVCLSTTVKKRVQSGLICARMKRKEVVFLQQSYGFFPRLYLTEVFCLKIIVAGWLPVRVGARISRSQSRGDNTAAAAVPLGRGGRCVRSEGESRTRLVESRPPRRGPRRASRKPP